MEIVIETGWLLGDVTYPGGAGAKTRRPLLWQEGSYFTQEQKVKVVRRDGLQGLRRR